MTTPAAQLRTLLAGDRLLVMPCCFDALSARMIERAGFPLTFMSGFAVSAARLGLPDTGLISFGEMLDQGRNICGAVSIPVIASGGVSSMEDLAALKACGAPLDGVISGRALYDGRIEVGAAASLLKS